MERAQVLCKRWHEENSATTRRVSKRQAVIASPKGDETLSRSEDHAGLQPLSYPWRTPIALIATSALAEMRASESNPVNGFYWPEADEALPQIASEE